MNTYTGEVFKCRVLETSIFKITGHHVRLQNSRFNSINIVS